MGVKSSLTGDVASSVGGESKPPTLADEPLRAGPEGGLFETEFLRLIMPGKKELRLLFEEVVDAG